jgi:hypothetical protein
LKPAGPVPDRLAQCVGEYSSLRRSFTSLTKLAAIMDTINVWVDPQGYLVSVGAGEGPKKWVEVEPLLFRETKGQERLAFRADAAGHITHLIRGPANAFLKLRWYEKSSFHHTVAVISMLVILTALAVWPIVAFCMRCQAGPKCPPRAPRILTWLMGFSLLLFFICVLQGVSDTQQFVFGVPSLIQRALWLPLVAIPLLAASMWFSIRAWTGKYWSLAGRIHYSLVTAAGLALLSWLYYWNLLGFQYK